MSGPDRPLPSADNEPYVIFTRTGPGTASARAARRSETGPQAPQRAGRCRSRGPRPCRTHRPPGRGRPGSPPGRWPSRARLKAREVKAPAALLHGEEGAGQFQPICRVPDARSRRLPVPLRAEGPPWSGSVATCGGSGRPAGASAGGSGGHRGPGAAQGGPLPPAPPRWGGAKGRPRRQASPASLRAAFRPDYMISMRQ